MPKTLRALPLYVQSPYAVDRYLTTVRLGHEPAREIDQMVFRLNVRFVLQLQRGLQSAKPGCNCAGAQYPRPVCPG